MFQGAQEQIFVVDMFSDLNPNRQTRLIPGGSTS